MATVSEDIRISAPAADVWATVRDFGAIDEYVPAVASAELSGTGVGAERTLTLAEGGQVVERLESIDDDTRTLRYTIVESPLPVEDYEGHLTVTEMDDSTCEVTWASSFEGDGAPDDEIAGTFSELYTVGLEGLNERHAG